LFFSVTLFASPPRNCPLLHSILRESKAQANAFKQKDHFTPTTTTVTFVPEKNNTPPLNNIMRHYGHVFGQNI